MMRTRTTHDGTATRRLLGALAVTTITAVTAGCGGRGPASSGDHSRPEEGFDLQNDPKILDLKPLRYDELAAESARRGATPVKPWKDSYWPYYKKNLAYRYAAGAEFGSFAEQQADAQANAASPTLSPAEKYDLLSEDPAMTLTAESWQRFDFYHQKYGEDLGKWSWMGICNGWAPASLNEPAPMSHVVGVNSAGREVLFLDGDLRALTSKAYDMNKMTESYRLVGNRCDDPVESVPRDEIGRPLDGMVKTTGEGFSIVNDYLVQTGAMEVKSRWSGSTFWLLADKPVRKASGEVQMWTYRTRADVAGDVTASTRGAHAQGAAVTVKFYRGCRDVNAATLHVALSKFLSDQAPADGKKGFVVELSRNEQVWNHPVWGFTTRLGKPRPVAEEPVPRRAFRAPGAAWIVDVKTRLVYVGGANPAPVYPEDDTKTPIDWSHLENSRGRYNLLDLNYSLEFDAGGMLVGGEWLEDPDDQIPDFFWKTYGTLTDDSRDGGPSKVKYSLVKRLLDCSQKQPDTQVDVFVDGVAQPVPAVRCQL